MINADLAEMGDEIDFGTSEKEAWHYMYITKTKGPIDTR